MKISAAAIELMNTRDNRFALAKALDVSEVTVRIYINKNENDGELTKVTALRIIREETGLTDDQILTEATEQVVSKNNAEKAVT